MRINRELLKMARESLQKAAFQPPAALAEAAAAGGGGMPPGMPMDPAMMGGAPPGGGGAPPMDPAMMGGAPPGGGAPPPDPAAGGAVPGGGGLTADSIRQIVREVMMEQQATGGPGGAAGGGGAGAGGKVKVDINTVAMDTFQNKKMLQQVMNYLGIEPSTELLDGPNRDPRTGMPMPAGAPGSTSDPALQAQQAQQPQQQMMAPAPPAPAGGGGGEKAGSDMALAVMDRAAAMSLVLRKRAESVRRTA